MRLTFFCFLIDLTWIYITHYIRACILFDLFVFVNLSLCFLFYPNNLTNLFLHSFVIFYPSKTDLLFWTLFKFCNQKCLFLLFCLFVCLLNLSYCITDNNFFSVMASGGIYFSYLHHNSQSLLIIFVHWTQLLGILNTWYKLHVMKL